MNSSIREALALLFCFTMYMGAALYVMHEQDAAIDREAARLHVSQVRGLR